MIHDAQGREVTGVGGPYLEGYSLALTCQVSGGKLAFLFYDDYRLTFRNTSTPRKTKAFCNVVEGRRDPGQRCRYHGYRLAQQIHGEPSLHR